MNMDDNLNSEENEIQEAFKILDKNGDGRLSAAELSSVFRSLGYNFSSHDIENMIRQIDKDVDKGLDFEEFQKLLKKQEENLKEGEDELIDAFRVFDRDGNGLITAEELKHVMLSLGESLSDQDLDEMIKHASNDPDNSFVTLKDFVSIYLK